MKPKYALFASLIPACGLSALPTVYKDAYGEAFTPNCIAEALRTDSAMTIDGLGNEAVWASAKSYVFDKVTWPVPSGLGWNDPVNGTPVAADDFSITYQAAWDASYLYLLIKVTDDAIVVDSTGTGYEKDDCVEIYLDGDNSRDKGTAWNQPGYDFINDRQLKVKANNATSPIGGLYDPNENGTVIIPQDIVVERRFVETDAGYNLEIKMNFSGIFRAAAGDGTLVQPVAENAYFGFDLKAADDDDGGERDITYGWCGNTNNSYADPTWHGTMVLTAPAAPAFELTVGNYKYDNLIGWTYGYDKTWGYSLMLGIINVAYHPSYIYSQSLGWLTAPSGTAKDGIFYYRASTGTWIWTSENYGGFYWDYGTSSWGNAL